MSCNKFYNRTHCIDQLGTDAAVDDDDDDDEPQVAHGNSMTHSSLKSIVAENELVLTLKLRLVLVELELAHVGN